MEKPRLITSYKEFDNVFENEDYEIDFDETLLDSIVDIVGSEQDVEDCAREAFEELEKAFERDELEVNDEDVAEKLVIAALIVKLVEKGLVGPEEADQFLEDKI